MGHTGCEVRKVLEDTPWLVITATTWHDGQGLQKIYIVSEDLWGYQLDIGYAGVLEYIVVIWFLTST